MPVAAKNHIHIIHVTDSVAPGWQNEKPRQAASTAGRVPPYRHSLSQLLSKRYRNNNLALRIQIGSVCICGALTLFVPVWEDCSQKLTANIKSSMYFIVFYYHLSCSFKSSQSKFVVPSFGSSRFSTEFLTASIRLLNLGHSGRSQSA